FEIGVAAGIRSSMGFSFDADFRFDINTTTKDAKIGSNTVKASTTLIYASGDVQITDSFRLGGTFTFSVSSKSIVLTASASVRLFGDTFAVSGSFTILSDGIVIKSKLSESAVNASFFTLSGDFELDINTTAKSNS